VCERDRLAINSELFCQSPLRKVIDGYEAPNIRSTDRAAITLNDLDVFEGRSLSDFPIEPSRRAGNPTSVVCFATANPAGSQIVDRAIVDRMLPALRTACELRMLQKMELPIPDSIIGTQTDQRGLTMRLRRSEGETVKGALMLRALVGCADIGGDGAGDEPFTALAAYAYGGRSLISGVGGLVLKASDDVILAVFPHDDPREACEAVLKTARDISEGIPAGRLQASVALHYGEIRYTDVGPDRTLHMTAIGLGLHWLQIALRGAGSDDGESITFQAF
jgi:adenylate cyclase